MFFFFFNDTATTEIYTLSLHDALPISDDLLAEGILPADVRRDELSGECERSRSEEHTSELQSQSNLVCRLLLEKKKKYPKQRLRVTPAETPILVHTYTCSATAGVSISA